MKKNMVLKSKAIGITCIALISLSACASTNERENVSNYSETDSVTVSIETTENTTADIEATTQAPTTQVPTTQAPTTQVPTTQVPTTQAPTTQTPTEEATTVIQSETQKYHVKEKLEETEKEVERLRKILREEATTQYDMNQLSYEISLQWNALLDYVWEALGKTLDGKTMAELEKEQQEWLTYREEEIASAEAEFGGGSMAVMEGCSTDSELTKNRIYKLLEYFPE